MKEDYKKQAENLREKTFNEGLISNDLIEYIIEARKQRDYYKKIAENHKKGNQAIAERILKIGNYLDKADKLCKLH